MCDAVEKALPVEIWVLGRRGKQTWRQRSICIHFSVVVVPVSASFCFLTRLSLVGICSHVTTALTVTVNAAASPRPSFDSWTSRSKRVSHGELNKPIKWSLSVHTRVEGACFYKRIWLICVIICCLQRARAPSPSGPQRGYLSALSLFCNLLHHPESCCL